MLMKIAQWLTAAILPDLQGEQQRLLCEYGCELWLYTVSSTLSGLSMKASSKADKHFDVHAETAYLSRQAAD